MSRGNKKGEFVSAVGIIFEIVKKISDAIRTLGGTDEDLRRLLTDSKLVKQIAELIMSGRQKASDTYKVVVDYSKTLTEMIQLGNYSYANNDITDRHFPIQGSGQHEVELVLVHLNKDATIKEVLAHLDGLGLKPASIEHLLTFGAANPNVQREFPIVALGSVWVDGHGDRGYPYLRCSGDERELRLYWCDDDDHWSGHCRFLALRK
ncbi:hypothetical protein JW977_02245 [Candidatus Falkowbacteria bacterium]|nr:hypothetical protein [Candidatus Falkowbacteria bacterium]